MRIKIFVGPFESALAMVAMLYLLSGHRCHAQEAHESPGYTSAGWLTVPQAASVDALFARPEESPGYAVGIIKDGRFVYKKGFGLANLDDDIPITADTSFHLASVS